MEQWEALIEGCPSPPDLRNFNKLVQSAGIVLLKEDLAQFEIEWIIQTILFKPLHLIRVVTNKRNDDLWTKAIGDAFKLLTDITKKYPESLQLYYEDIVTICLLPFDTLARKQALVCASEIARVSSAGARDVKKHINSLEEVTTCKAPLIGLVGTICEYYPEVVTEDSNRIWRIFLNLLESNKNTDTITSALLQGILSLFKNFGSDLPMAELNSFYDQMTNELVGVSKCEDVILNILSRHASLFRERLSRDSRTRSRLWLCLQESHKAKSAVQSVYRAICGVLDAGSLQILEDLYLRLWRAANSAVQSVYRAICGVLGAGSLQNIIASEIVQQVSSNRTQVKYTALRILSYIRMNKPLVAIEMADFDVQMLECELRIQEVSYDTAEAISWCIESNLPDSDTLLHTAIALYTNIPTTKRKEIVVYGILNAPEELRTSAITFLISESTISEDSLERYLPLWRLLFDHNGGKDTVIVENCRLVVDGLVAYVNFVVRSFLDEQAENIPDKLTNLLNLSHHVLTLSPEEFSTEYFDTLRCLVRELVEEYGPSSAMVAAARVVGGSDICKMIPIDRCKDEALLCEACLAIIQSDIDDVDNVMMALQIIFSRTDVEPKTLSQALKRLEGLISANKNAIDEKVLNEVIQKIQRLRDRKDLVDKEARVLHRDVLMFLGKHGARTDINNNLSVSETTLIVKLKSALSLNLPCPVEGNTYKINLQEILQLALTNEDANVLQTLLSIICTNLSTRPNPHLRLALTRVVVSLARCHSRGDSISPSAIESAMMLCDDIECVTEVLKYISEEKSPGVRKMLSDALEGLLKRPENDSLINSVTERAMVMCNATTPTIKRAGLDITHTLVLALKENNSLSTNLLPNTLVTVSKTFETDSEATFRSASELFLEKIELFDENTQTKLTNDLLMVLLSYNLEIKEDIVWKAYKKSVETIVEFIKKTLDHRNVEYLELSEMLSECHKQDRITPERSLYILAEMRRIFDLDTEHCRIILSCNNCELLYKLLKTELKYSCDSYVRLEAVLRFLDEYADVLLELQYREVLDYLGTTITNMSPTHVKYLQKVLKSCISTYAKKFNNVPQVLTVSLTDWCQNLPLDQMTESMIKEHFDESHAVTLRALKVMLDIFHFIDVSVLTNVSVNARKWPAILLKIFSNEFSRDRLKMKLSHVTDIMTVAVKFIPVTDVKKILLEGVDIHGVANEKIGLKFCKFFIHVFCEVLVRKPFLLVEDDMKSCCIIVNDVVKYVLKKKMSDQVYGNVLELVDELWPIYEPQATFTQKHSLLLDISNLPKKLPPESNPMQWAMQVVASDAGVGRKAKLVGVMPGGEAYSQTYRTFASLLPTRLSEMRGPAHTAFRAILDSLAVNRDQQLFEIVMALAAGDNAKGWWDEAINSCVAALSADSELLCMAAYARCFDGLSTGVCERVLVPLLRYSSPQFCERFYSSIIHELVNKLYNLKPSSSTHYKYQESVADVTRVLALLRVAFEKVPSTSIESPSSLLYSAMPTDQPWYLIRRVCKACVALQKLLCPDMADDQFRENIRLFHCANYNCLTTAICLRKPEANFYNYIFDPAVWEKTINRDVKYQLRLRNTWSNRTKRQPTSIATDSHLNPHIMTSHTTMTSRSMTSRTRMFLRTLSDNPMRYDLFYDEGRDDVVASIELELDDNELNSHECCPTLTSLFCHVASLSHTEWRENTVSALTAEGVRCEAKCLVAQAIVNCKEELRSHASELRPALLAFVADTVSVENGRRLLNRMHVDIIEVLLQWGDSTPEPSPQTDSVLYALINTCLENRQRKNIFNSLASLLDKILEVYKSVAKVDGEVFEPYLTDTTADALKTIQILGKITKSKVHIPELLPILITKIEGKQYFGQLSKIAELFGLAMDCQMDHGVLGRFRKVLEHIRRSNGGDYVKMLYYSQKGCSRICDERNFRTTIDLLPKITGVEKPKCLQILSSYVHTHPRDDSVQDMFRTIDISELLSQDYCVEALGVLRGGLGGLEEGVRRRVVRQVGGLCGHSKEKVRKAAFEVMLKVFEDLLESPQSSSSSKRLKTTIRTPIINSIDHDDQYTCLVLCCIGQGLMDGSEGIRSMVKESVARFLYGDCMAVRFTECFLLTIYYPIKYRTNTNNNKDVSVCLSSLLDLLLAGLRDDQRFQKVLLRDEPLATSRPPSTAPSRLLTMSRTYQGTFRSRSLASRRTIAQSTSTSDIDVQIPLKSILDTLLQFAKSTPEVASILCLQLLRALPSDNPNFELGPTLGYQLPTVLAKERSELTPFLVEMCRLFVKECSDIASFKTALDSLQSHTKGTEGESHTKLLYEEYYLCKGDTDMFLLGLYGNCDDVKMEEELPFCMEDLASVFCKLSNWDDLTIQRRRSIMNEGLPPLWTDKNTFKASLDHYTGEGWFGTMVSAYRSEKEECIKWLRDVDRWPRRPFCMSAVTEAIDWLYAVDDTNFPCDILPSDCLAEWAARLMIRATHLNSLDNDENTNNSLSRSHELRWCERANETQLSTAVVDCVRRNMGNTRDLYHNETLPWLRQKATALRWMGLQQRDDSKLEKALTDAETYTPKFMNESSPDCVIAMNKLILQLNQDLNSLSTEKINKIVEEVDRQNAKTNIQSNNKSLSSIYEIAMTYYDGQWESGTDTAEKHDILANMTSILRHVVDMSIPHADIFLATILNTFDNCSLIRESTATSLLDIIQHLIDNLDDFSVKELRSHSPLFASHLLPSYPFMSERDNAIVEKYKRCFELVNDAEYLLLEYCDWLMRALTKNDLSGWSETFERMKGKMFENPYAGTDYQLLTKFKNKLYEIEYFEISSSYTSKAQSILRDIIRELRPRNRQKVLRLTQMCPNLGTSRASDPCVGKLLGLPDGVYVVKFDEQVPVFTDSIRRPTVLKALLSDGTTRRYLHKSGESLYADAAVQRIQSVANNICGACVVGYKVTPLSEDCGLIEFLEDYERVRNLITETCDLDTILDTVGRPADDELILSPSIAAIHAQLCEKTPAKSLRSAIQLHSATTQDFIAKKHRFQETLASMTILNWILGVGDRHLQNIMYGLRDGSLCGVDLASCTLASEGPARLTRTVAAACDRTVLESRLQQLLCNLRNSYKLLLPVVKIAFKRLGPQFDEKIEHLTSILEGRSLSHHITLQAIEKGSFKYKNKYMELFNNVFADCVEKDVYSIEDQITSLLRHCTDPRILGVVRSGWEPWV